MFWQHVQLQMLFKVAFLDFTVMNTFKITCVEILQNSVYQHYSDPNIFKKRGRL